MRKEVADAIAEIRPLYKVKHCLGSQATIGWHDGLNATTEVIRRRLTDDPLIAELEACCQEFGYEGIPTATIRKIIAKYKEKP